MKKNYLFFLLLTFTLFSFGQSSCEDVFSDMNYVNINIKKSFDIDVNFIDDLKFYAKKANESLERAQERLNNCDCQKSKKLVENAINFYKKIPEADTYENARFYVIKIKDLANETIYELNRCATGSDDELVEDENKSVDQDLADLKQEQLELEQQQLALKQKKQQIKLKLEERARKELALEKERLITKQEDAISSTIKVYNDMFSTCNCNTTVLTVDENTELLKTKTVDAIKTHYIEKSVGITEDYLSKLKLCKK